MKRKSPNAPPTKIYSYALPHGPDAECKAAVERQLGMARGLRNRIIDLYRAKIVAYQEARTALCPRVAAAEEGVAAHEKELEEARKALTALRVQGRSRARDAGLEERIRAAKKQLSEARAVLREEKKGAANMTRLKERAEALNDKFRDDVKSLYAEFVRSGEERLFWPTFNAVRTATFDACNKAHPYPSFRRWDGTGFIAMQIIKGEHGGLSAARLMAGDDGRIRIRIDDRTRRLPRGKLFFRIGSTNEKRRPIFATFNILMHRPLPADAEIKEARITRRIEGPRTRWTLHLFVEAESFRIAKRVDGPVCAINLGWRKVDDAHSLRVAYLVSASEARPIVLEGREHLSRKRSGNSRGQRSGTFLALRHADKIRGHRQDNFNEIKAKLLEWVRAQDAEALPEWFRERTKNLVHWRSLAAMASLVLQWRKQRFSSDVAMMGDGGDRLGLMEAWYRRDRHLHQYEHGDRSKAIASRNEFYRLIGIEVAKKYATVIFEDTDFAKLKERKKVEDSDTEIEAAQRLQLDAASPGELRSIIAGAVTKRGGQVHRVDAAGISMTCYRCGEECEWDRAKELNHECEHCGAVWDQDENAARNLLERWRTGGVTRAA